MEPIIFDVLEELTNDDFEKFKFYLRHVDLEGIDPIKAGPLDGGTRITVAQLINQKYTSNADQVMEEVLAKINMNDLVLTFKDKLAAHRNITSVQDTTCTPGRMKSGQEPKKRKHAVPSLLKKTPGPSSKRSRTDNSRLSQPGTSSSAAAVKSTRGHQDSLFRGDVIVAPMDVQEPLDPSLPPPILSPTTLPSPPPDFLVKTQKDTHPITYYQDKLKTNVKEPFASLPEGAVQSQDKKDYECYTRLTLLRADDTKTKSEHEVTQKKAGQEKKAGQDIQLSEIYKHPSRKNKRMRTVMSIGEAGVGKTFLANKFISDWAKNKDQDPHLTFLLRFRDLNSLRGKEFTLAQLLHECIDATKCIPEEALDYIFNELQTSANANYDLSPVKVMFVLEGLDECHLKLDWNVRSKDVTKALPLEILLVNLINGNLLRSAHLWITTRPAAAKLIPDGLVDLVTEVRGFTHEMIEKYIEKRFTDKVQASKILSHIKATMYLQVMCETPAFCSIIASVLEDMLTDERGELPKTLADIYSRFIYVQTKMKWLKCGENRKKLSEADKAVLLKLGRLAFEHLQKSNLIFYEDDLKRCDLDIKEGPMDSGLCTEIFKRDSKFYQETVYCFVHLSIQEFLAAVYLFDCFTQKNMEVLKTFLNDDDFNCNSSLSDFLKAAMEKTVQSESGHLDLFNRFLHGLSLKSNQIGLGGLLETQDSPGEIQKVITNLKEMDPCSGSPDRCINIFQCLMEMKASSVSQGIQQYLESSGEKLDEIQCSALVKMLQMSDEVLEVLDLDKYYTSDGGRLTLILAVRNCTTARLAVRVMSCQFQKEDIEVVASALSSNPSHLRHLDLSYNWLAQLDLEPLKAALNSPHCKLETLRLVGCDLQKKHIEIVASALSSNPSHLRHLDLSSNNLLDLEPLKALNSPHCKLETLRLIHCWLSERSCEVLASFLSSNPCHLRELDLSLNRLLDFGIELLCTGVKIPNCQLQILRLSGCGITEKGCSSLASAVALNPSFLKHVDLSCNHPGGDAVQTLLSAGLNVNVNHGGEQWIEHWTNPQLLKRYFQILSLDTNTAHRKLSLSQNNRKATLVEGEDQNYPPHADRFDIVEQVLCTEGLTGRYYWEVDWSGQVEIAVTYREISRKGRGDNCWLGATEHSWSLFCCVDAYVVNHNSKETDLPDRPSRGLRSGRVAEDEDSEDSEDSEYRGRVAVYLDCPAGILSFYEVSEDTLTHLYTFQNTFTGPLYAGFRLDPSSSVSLCEQS